MRAVCAIFGFVVLATPAFAGTPECTNPNALGVSRTIVVDPAEHPRVGTMQYHETLPLNDHEVVLTFDDGPLPPRSTRILDILASECVKATYFMVGRMAMAYPDTVRKIAAAGHTIGTHSQNHPFRFEKLPLERLKAEVDVGIASVSASLGEGGTLAPFFRVPGLGRRDDIEQYLAWRGIMTWSADFPADDWKRIGPAEVARRAISRLEAKGRGILLLHDIHDRTVIALPIILRELKARGYKIVHVVPASEDTPKTDTEVAQWVLKLQAHASVPVHLTDAEGAELAGAVAAAAKVRKAPVSAAKRKARHDRRVRTAAKARRIAATPKAGQVTVAPKAHRVAAAPKRAAASAATPSTTR